MPKRKKLTGGITKAPKGVAGMGLLMSQGMSASAAKNLMKKARELKPSGRISKDDLKRVMQKGPRPMQKKLGDIPMGKGPNKMDKQKTPMKKALAPVRSIRERAKQSRLVGGKSKFTKPKR